LSNHADHARHRRLYAHRDRRSAWRRGRNLQEPPVAGARAVARGARRPGAGVWIMTDERFDELMRDAKKTYRTPPNADFAALWHSVEAEHFGGGARGTRHDERPRSMRWPGMQWVGIAATLLVGIGIGRVSLRFDHASPVTTKVASVDTVARTKVDTAMARPY